MRTLPGQLTGASKRLVCATTCGNWDSAHLTPLAARVLCHPQCGLWGCQWPSPSFRFLDCEVLLSPLSLLSLAREAMLPLFIQSTPTLPSGFAPSSTSWEKLTSVTQIRRCFHYRHCIEEPQDQLQAQWYAKGTQEASQLLDSPLQAIRAAEGERAWGKGQRKPGGSFQEAAPHGVIDNMLDFMCDNPCRASLTREFRVRKGVCHLGM